MLASGGKHRVIYHAHPANTIDLTFGLMHTVEKSAEILVKVRSMQPAKRQTITPDDFRRLARDFGVNLPEQFLFEKD